MTNGLYFASQYDNEWHNLYDVKHILHNNKTASIGEMTNEGFRVDEEVDVFTWKEVLELYKEEGDN